MRRVRDLPLDYYLSEARFMTWQGGINCCCELLSFIITLPAHVADRPWLHKGGEPPCEDYLPNQPGSC